MEDEKDLKDIETLEIPILSDEEADSKEHEKVEIEAEGGL